MLFGVHSELKQTAGQVKDKIMCIVKPHPRQHGTPIRNLNREIPKKEKEAKVSKRNETPECNYY